MKTTYLLSVLAAFLVGCEQTQTEYSDNMTESATVVDLVFMPKNHGSGVNPTLHSGGDGNLHVGVAFTEIDIPEKYAVVFECQHGKFVVEDDQEKTKGLYQKLHRDEKVTVTYQEVYEVVKDGDKIVSPRKLIKFHFIDAQPVLKPVEHPK